MLSIRWRSALPVLVASALLAACAQASPASPVKADKEYTFPHDRRERQYLVHLPPQHSAEAALPVVLVLHGGGGDAKGAARMTQMNVVADRYGFIAVYPSGTAALGSAYTWNAGTCCGYAMKHNVDDVGFIRALLDDLAARFLIDTSRVYATGMSNGAQMSYRLACELPEKIAAIVPVAGQSLMEECPDGRAVPVLHIHGTADPCALYQGGEACGQCFGRFFGKFGIPLPQAAWRCQPVPASITTLANRYGCAAAPQGVGAHGAVSCITYSGCRDGAEVRLCSIRGGGHTWPGGEAGPEFCATKPNGRLCVAYKEVVGAVSTELDASEAAWAFFRRHRIGK